jgi:hydroxymethylpyrimidine/phosphomethylpyrimidine kinase
VTPARLLIIAGSDSSGGAGIQADIKTAVAFGAYAMTAVTAVTAQNTMGVRVVHPVPPDIVRQQVVACLSDVGADAIKIGMIANAAIAEAVADVLEECARMIPVVVDPVMASGSGKSLLGPGGERMIRMRLLPLAYLATPNIPEAERLTGLRRPRGGDTRSLAVRLREMGPKAVLIKGGHSRRSMIHDLLVWDKGEDVLVFPRIKTRHTHGTGCTLATAIACGLAQGLPLPFAVSRAREYLQAAIADAPGLGKGHGPLNHAVKWR